MSTRAEPSRYRNPEQLYRVLDDAGLGKPGGSRNVEGMDQIRFEAASDRSEQELKGYRENQGQGRSNILAWPIYPCNTIIQKVAVILKDQLLPQYFKRRHVWIPIMYPPTDFP